MLEQFAKCHINVVVFQIRPTSDAFYKSEIEPWSRYLTGTQGLAPKPLWDPLEFMIKECHKRGMELHAWLNPYRVTQFKNDELDANHIYNKKPEIFVEYDNRIYFDPGFPESREHIENVVADIVTRYDIDAIHMDDYFYPYKVKDPDTHKVIDFPDGKSYAKYGKDIDLGDWRRNNVNKLIKKLRKKIKSIKPWVKFGISPFGIWRNLKSDPTGSKTNGLQNYDDLYADIKLWVKNKWIDYNAPQIYWDIGHPLADYETLVKWWADNNFGVNLYIGQRIALTTKVPSRKTKGKYENQFPRKMELVRTNPKIQGNIWWPGYSILKNPDGFTDALKKAQAHIALVPLYKDIDTKAPLPVEKLSLKNKILTWTYDKTSDKMQCPYYFAIYLNNEKYPAKLIFAEKFNVEKKIK